MNQVTVSGLGELPYAMEEAVNRLRINIGFLGQDVHKIMVISTFPNEGKSLVSLQLWRQMANSGVKSVFVDVDLRNSVLTEEHPLETADKKPVPGTSDYLAGKISLEDVLCKTQFPAGDLVFNVKNVINPSMLMQSKRFSDMLDQLAKDYQYVFLDTPPLDLVSDGEAIGAMCDGAILVVRSGVTPTAAVRSSMAQLERAGCPVLGVVLNRVNASKAGYYGRHYGHYGHYGKYYYGKHSDKYYYGKHDESREEDTEKAEKA